MRALDELLTPARLPPIVHCAKPSLSPSLERIRSVTRAISQAPAVPWPRGSGGGLSVRGHDVGGEVADERAIAGLPPARDFHSSRVRHRACASDRLLHGWLRSSRSGASVRLRVRLYRIRRRE